MESRCCGADAVEGQSVRSLSWMSTTALGQLGHVHEDALLVVVIGQAIFARLFVDREHALGQIGIVFQEILAGELRMPQVLASLLR